MTDRLDTKADMEARYAAEDPWGFRDHVDDIERKRRILGVCDTALSYYRGLHDYETGSTKLMKPRDFARALDIGAGEGWITKDLPACELYAYEISDRAAARLPEKVTRFDVDTQGMRFDLVTATGVFYEHYDWRAMHHLTQVFAVGIVVTCHISESEIPLAMKPIYVETFPYRGKMQRLAVYDFTRA